IFPKKYETKLILKNFNFWRVYLHGIQLSVVKLSWMSRVIFRSLLNGISQPADAASAGFSASFGLDFVWKKQFPKGGRR
ncbi:MAG: hypothetical protein J7J46_08085, partial [Candidatus Desulfofervidus sp.]|nr:hypothetical protein [Candidatus Desulfofervidus sp.]